MNGRWKSKKLSIMKNFFTFIGEVSHFGLKGLVDTFRPPFEWEFFMIQIEEIGGRSICGTLTGTPIDSEDTLSFSVLENIRPMVETFPLEQAADAYARMMQGKARFRMVLVTGQEMGTVRKEKST